MLGDIAKADRVYIACGYTDMRRSIDGLAAIVQEKFNLNPFENKYLRTNSSGFEFLLRIWDMFMLRTSFE